jgi:uncharacterized protein (TIGR02246 family)
MTLEQARAVHAAWVAAFNSGNLDALVAMYEPDAVVIPPGGPVLYGRNNIREGIGAFIALKGKMSLTATWCYATKDTALIRASWKLEGGRAPDGTPIPLAGDAIETHRRQPDGKWLIAVDHPTGAN